MATVRCTMPKQIGDTRYVYGGPHFFSGCMWHGPIALAGTALHKVDVTSYGDEEQRFESVEVPCCPICKNSLREMPTEAEWWANVACGEREHPGFEAMLRWSQGKCFPDFDTLQNAYWQAMEGQN